MAKSVFHLHLQQNVVNWQCIQTFKRLPDDLLYKLGFKKLFIIGHSSALLFPSMINDNLFGHLKILPGHVDFRSPSILSVHIHNWKMQTLQTQLFILFLLFLL